MVQTLIDAQQYTWNGQTREARCDWTQGHITRRVYSLRSSDLADSAVYGSKSGFLCFCNGDYRRLR